MLPHWTVLLLAQVRLGGVVSTTVTTCVQVLTPPPQQLLACHTCEMALGQPAPLRRLVELLSRVKARLVQHRSMKGGGLVGMGLPHSTTMPAAVEHCMRGASIWPWTGNETATGPDVVICGIGDIVTQEAVAAAWLLRHRLPGAIPPAGVLTWIICAP